MATKKMVMVWKSIIGVQCTVSAWSHMWVKISHPAFKGSRVFRTKGAGRPFCCFSVPTSDGTCLVYRISGPVLCNPATFVF